MVNNKKVAIITGAGRGLGRYIAIALARNGYRVVVNYNRSGKEAEKTVELIRSQGNEAITVKADISKILQVKRMANLAIKKFGRIDLLVNNSSIFRKSSFLETTEKTWDETFNVNLKGAFLCAQAVAPSMLKRKSGNIINITSVAGSIGWTQYLPYSISKAGLIMLTRTLSKSLAPNIRVNSISPGFIQIKGKIQREKMPKSKIPLHKYGTVQDITEMVIFLAEKAEFITGQVINVDGGRSIN